MKYAWIFYAIIPILSLGLRYMNIWLIKRTLEFKIAESKGATHFNIFTGESINDTKDNKN